jgi:hypothetical protein
VHVSGLVVPDRLCEVLDILGHVEEGHDLGGKGALLSSYLRGPYLRCTQACQGHPGRKDGMHIFIVCDGRV